MKNYLASAIGALQGLSSQGAEAARAAAGGDPLLARAAPAAIGAGIGALAAGARKQDVARAAETFGLGPASRAMGIEGLMQRRMQPQMQMAPMQPQMGFVQPQAQMQMQPQMQMAPMQAMPVAPQMMPMQPVQPPMQQPQQMPNQQPMQPGQGFARGGYVTGPGTGRSDGIPAVIMQNGRPVQRAALSDGEFVMTERAVRGAGDGDRAKGAARMYRMMREFEKGGRV